MKAWKPIEEVDPSHQYNKSCIATYDFEWVTSETSASIRSGAVATHLPYSFGIMADESNYWSWISKQRGDLSDIYASFNDRLIDLLAHYREQQDGWLKGDDIDADEETRAKISAKRRVRVLLFGFNSQRADYPLVQKRMMKDVRSKFVRQCASGAAQISYTWTFPEIQGVDLVFCDLLTHLKGSLDGLLKQYQCKTLKGDVDHSKIDINTLWNEIPRQRIEAYQRADCEGLYELILKYDTIVTGQLGWSFIANGVLTSASLAEKAFFSAHYDEKKMPIYLQTAEDSAFCRQAYAGGMVDTFVKGYHPRVAAWDLNSSYPSSMLAPLPVGPYHKMIIGREYQGEPLQQGVYRVNIIFTPQISYPSIGIKSDGKYVFPRLQDYEVHITSEEVFYAHTLGYRLFMIEAVVSMRSERVYDSFIGDGYARRCAAKKMMSLISKFMNEDLTENREQKIKALDDTIVEQCSAIIKSVRSKLDDCLYNNGSLKNLLAYLDGMSAITKLTLNSAYGKLCWADKHEVTGQLCEDAQELIRLFQDGDLRSIEVLDDRYVAWSGETRSKVNHTNFMMGAFITARSRILLLKGLYAVEKSGNTPLYSDTDSIYVGINNEEALLSALGKIDIGDQLTCDISAMFDKGMFRSQTVLGGLKDETYEAVQSSYAEGVFIAPKLYALRGTTGVVKIRAKGISEWMIKQDKSAASRREQSGQSLITFEDMMKLAGGQVLCTQQLQQMIVKKNMVGDSENLKIERLLIKQTTGAITKRDMIHMEDGTRVCIPKLIVGDSIAPEAEPMLQHTHQYCSQADAETALRMSFSDICDKYCVLKDTQHNVYICPTPATAERAVELLGLGECHQVFGMFMIPSFDIDCVLRMNADQEQKSAIAQALPKLLKRLRAALQLTEHHPEFSVVDRSRDTEKGYKLSYHIRLPGFIVQRAVLLNVVSKTINDALVKMTDKNAKTTSKTRHVHLLLTSLDKCIYRSCGMLRVTDTSALYRTGLPILHVMSQAASDAAVEKHKRQQKLMPEGDGLKCCRERTIRVLKSQKIEKDWVFRQAKQNDKDVCVELSRTSPASKQCIVCSCTHDRDNYLYLRLLPKHTYIHCRKAPKGQKIIIKE